MVRDGLRSERNDGQSTTLDCLDFYRVKTASIEAAGMEAQC